MIRAFPSPSLEKEKDKDIPRGIDEMKVEGVRDVFFDYRNLRKKRRKLTMTEAVSEVLAIAFYRKVRSCHFVDFLCHRAIVRDGHR